MPMLETTSVMTSTTTTASVLTGDRDLEALAPEWEALLEHSDQRSFFLRWGWIELWWRIFRPPHSRLFIITCRDDRGELVGLAPFYWKQRRTAGVPHLRELQFLGTGVYAQTSEYLDVVARRGYEQSVADAVGNLLRRDANWDRLFLTEIPAASTVLPLFRQALGLDAQISACNCSYYIKTDTDWDTFRNSLSRRARENIFRRARRLFKTFECDFRLVDNAGELEPAMDALIRLHQARWTSKGEPGAFALPGTEDLLREAARIALSGGWLRLWTLTLNNQVSAVLLGFVDNGVLNAFQSGFDPAYVHNGLGSVMNGLCVRACVGDEAVRYYNFMGGNDTYKQSWTKTSWESVSLTWLRPGFNTQTFKAIELAAGIGKAIIRKTIPKRIKLAAHKFIMKRRYY